MRIPSFRASGPAPLYEFFINDFSGGLHYGRPGFTPDSKFSSEACNVDWMEDGGFCLRRSARSFATTSLPSPVCSIGYFELDSVRRWTVVSLDDGSVWTGGGDGQPLTQLIPAGGACKRVSQINDKLYIQDGTAPARFWDGQNLTTLGQGYNVSPIGSPTYTNGNMPIGKFVIQFNGRTHVLDTLENGVRYCNRVRTSMAMINNRGEQDYQTDAWTDLAEGTNGECIQGAAVCGQKMFILRQHSLHTFDGFDPSSYQFSTVSTDRGASGPKAFACCNDVLFAWDSVVGLHATSGYSGANGIQREILSDPISALLRDMVLINQENVVVTCCGGKVMVSADHKTKGRMTWAYDLRLKTWTCYDYGISAGGMFAPNGGAKTECLAGSATKGCPNRLLKLDQMEGKDECGAGEKTISATVSTGWYHDGKPTVRKIWKCATFLYETESNGSTSVEVYNDWDNTKLVAGLNLAGSDAAAKQFMLGGPGQPCSSLLETQMEIMRPGAQPTPVKCPKHPVGCPELCPRTQPTQKRKQRLSCKGCSVRLVFRSPLPSDAWCVRGFSIQYCVDPVRC